MQKTLFKTIDCLRCGERCRVAGPPGKEAKMLRFAKQGMCVNCAVHDFLRNTYPLNILLAQSGPRVLLFPHIQEQFAGIMKVGLADAKPDEIDWQKIVDNWELPFPNKMKPSSMNPVSEKELDEIAAGTRPGLGQLGPIKPDPLEGVTCITSFEQLNQLKPGLGDELRKCLRAE